MAWDKTKPADGTAMVASDVRENMEWLDRLMRSGSDTTNSTTGRTISIDSALEDTNYQVDIEFTANSANAGGVWIGNKSTNAFVLYNSGNAGIAFNWSTRPKMSAEE